MNFKLDKKRVHMDQIKYQVSTQVALEDDRNLQDNKPDITAVLSKTYRVKIEDIKALNDHVRLKGKLYYDVLYWSDEEVKISQVGGEIAFDEQVYMEGIKPEDQLYASWNLEDLTIGLINSRKLSIQAVIGFVITAEDLIDQELPAGFIEAESMEQKLRTLDVAGIFSMKKDLFRVRDEIELPQNYPNIGNLIWSDIDLQNLEFKASQDKMMIQGEAIAFFLYENAGEEAVVYAYTAAIPINGSIECQGAEEYMVPSVSYELNNLEVEVHHDFDGEDRNFGIELVLDLYVKLYREDKVTILADCYSTNTPLTFQTAEKKFKTAMIRHSGKCKLQENIPDNGISDTAKVLHGRGNIVFESRQATEKGLELLGSLDTSFLLRDDQSGRFYTMEATLPFHYVLEIPNADAGGICNLNSFVEQLQMQRTNQGYDVKAQLGFDTTAFRLSSAELIEEIMEDEEALRNHKRTPGMVCYIAKSEDDYWDVGKRFMVSQANLKEMNHLEKEKLRGGDQLLIIR